MKKSRHLFCAAIIIVLVFTTSCSTFTPRPSPTATPVPLSERDLSMVVMQANDLPSEFNTYSTETLAGVFPDLQNVHEGVVNSHVVLNKTGDSRQVFSSGIIVYEDEEQAGKAFQSIKSGTRGVSFTVPELGDEQYAMNDELSSEALTNVIHLSIILWRVEESVLYLSAANSDNRPSVSQMTELAQKIQDRVNGST